MSLTIIEDAQALEERLSDSRDAGSRIGFVQTMGALHEGHGSLVSAARAAAGVVVTSIFVNPLQFGPGEDLERYPRTLAEDQRYLEKLGCDILYLPRAASMYPEGFATRVEMRGLTEVLCGRSRPGHFSGVLTVVLKLLHQVRPHLAFFGEKDYQQYLVIRRMVRDLDLPIEIVPCATVRESDGLALSSRNAYLSPEERAQAPAPRQALLAMNEAFLQGERGVPALLALGREIIGRRPLVRIDYLEIRGSEDLAAREVEALEGDLVAVAVFLGRTRLIDNLLLGSGA